MILLQQAAHLVLEPSINQLLTFDHSANKKLTKLEGKGFGVSLSDLQLNVQLKVQQNKLLFSSNLEGNDCLVKAKLSQLQNLSDASLLTKMIKNDDLELEGDLNVAQGFAGLLMDNQIAWQEILSKLFGDAMAHRIAHGAQGLQSFIQRKIQDADYTMASGLTDELRVTPDKIEVDRFINDVDILNGQVEKLQHTIKQLKANV